MDVIYLISIILGVSAQDVLKKMYTKKSNNGTALFGAMMSLAAIVFFTILGGHLQWDVGILPYSIAFALFFSMTTICGVSAIACGPLSLTTLIVSYSLMLPTLYGIFVDGDDVSGGLIVGIALLAVSLLLITKKSEKAPLTLKWGIFAALTFIGNGMCSITQKMQQTAFNKQYKNELMIVAYLISAVVLLVFALVKERPTMKQNGKSGWYLALICGGMNGMVNLFILILSSSMALSLMFPLVSAGGIVVTYLISRFVYKEELTRLQFAGFILGVASVVLLNI